MSNISKAVVLVSGGMDSLVTAAIADTDHNIALLHCSYGQNTQRRELKAFNDIAGHYSVSDKLTCDLSSLSKIGGSSLTDADIPVSDADLTSEDIPTSYVPFRNAHFLSTAVSWAEVLGANKIFIGAVEEDSSGYPDCRREFFDNFEKTANSGTKPETKIRIITPIIHLNKREIIRKAIEMNAPLHLTWSCYANEDKACGKCDSCALRLKAFKSESIKDPIIYDFIPEEFLT